MTSLEVVEVVEDSLSVLFSGKIPRPIGEAVVSLFNVPKEGCKINSSAVHMGVLKDAQ